MKKCDICGEPVLENFYSEISRGKKGLSVTQGHKDCFQKKRAPLERNREKEPEKSKGKYCYPLSPNVPDYPTKPYIRPQNPNWDYVDDQGLVCRFFTERVEEHKKEVERKVGLKWWTGGKLPPYVDTDEKTETKE